MKYRLDVNGAVREIDVPRGTTLLACTSARRRPFGRDSIFSERCPQSPPSGSSRATIRIR